jgi:hypothetical protein
MSQQQLPRSRYQQKHKQHSLLTSTSSGFQDMAANPLHQGAGKHLGNHR